MKFSLNTIQRFVDVKSVPFDEFTKRFSYSIAEIEGYENFGEKYNGMFIGEIIDISNHPNSDKLIVVKLNIGNEIVQVCAGAKNIKKGDKVCYIKPGNKTPVNPYPEREHVEIEKKMLGGVESNGMIMSEKELGFGDDHSQILVLKDKNLKVGQTVAEAFDLDDVIVEVENKTFTHRPDCFGLVGIAREISAQFDLPLDLSSLNLRKSFTNREGETLNFTAKVKNPTNCVYVQRYTMQGMSNIQIEKSPLWLKIFLIKHDIKSINNVVDATNYVMIMLGQPLHAFDYDLSTHNIIVRTAKRSEKFLALDNKVYELDNENVVISDDEKILGLGGVIGGKDSRINENTKNILIEAATFDLYNIRRTSMKLGLFTDAVTRFGKGQDPESTVLGLNLCIDLIKELSNAKVSSNAVDIYPYVRKSYEINLNFDYLYKRIGVNSNELSKEKIENILKRLELNPKIVGKSITLTIPTFRYDLKNKEDILEEVARMYGYNKITPQMPVRSSVPVKPVFIRDLKNTIKKTLVSCGGNELLTYSLVGEDLYRRCNLDISKAYHIQNALSPDLAYMRTTLVPSLLDKVVLNCNRGYSQRDFLLFEVNQINIKGEIDSVENVPLEYHNVAGVYCNPIDKSNGSPYYFSKYFVENLLRGINIKSHKITYTLLSDFVGILPIWLQNSKNVYHPSQTAIIQIVDSNVSDKEYPIGIVGAINPIVLQNLKISKFTSAFEICINDIKKSAMMDSNYQELYTYPPSIQDMCFVVDKNVQYQTLINAIMNSDANNVIERIDPIDIFADETIADNKSKQITLRIFFNCKDRQIKSNQVELARNQVIKAVENATNGVLKSNSK